MGGEKGPLTLELEKQFSLAAQVAFGGEGFKWTDTNWKTWKQLAQGQLCHLDHMAALDAHGLPIIINGPESKSAPWSVTTNHPQLVTFHNRLAETYELSAENRYVPTIEEVSRITEERQKDELAERNEFLKKFDAASSALPSQPIDDKKHEDCNCCEDSKQSRARLLMAGLMGAGLCFLAIWLAAQIFPGAVSKVLPDEERIKALKNARVNWNVWKTENAVLLEIDETCHPEWKLVSTNHVVVISTDPNFKPSQYIIEPVGTNQTKQLE